jgi:hypothetical protein
MILMPHRIRSFTIYPCFKGVSQKGAVSKTRALRIMILKGSC